MAARCRAPRFAPWRWRWSPAARCCRCRSFCACRPMPVPRSAAVPRRASRPIDRPPTDDRRMILRLLAWNIRQGGGTRLARIIAAIAQHEADVLVISEYRGGESGERLRAALAAAGYAHVTGATPPAGGNGVLIAASFRRWRRADRHRARTISHCARLFRCAADLRRLHAEPVGEGAVLAGADRGAGGRAIAGRGARDRRFQHLPRLYR